MKQILRYTLFQVEDFKWPLNKHTQSKIFVFLKEFSRISTKKFVYHMKKNVWGLSWAVSSRWTFQRTLRMYSQTQANKACSKLSSWEQLPCII